MFPRSPAPLTLLAAALLGCGAADAPSGGAPNDSVRGGQTGEESGACRVRSRESLELGARSVLGMSAEEVLSAAAGVHELSLGWADGGSTPLQLVLEDPAAAELVEYELAGVAGPGAGAPEPALAPMSEPGLQGCPRALAISLTMSFTTSDGSFDERWPVVLYAEAPALARIEATRDGRALTGSYRPAPLQLADSDDVSLFFALRFEDGAWSGAISGAVTSVAGEGPDATVSAEEFPVASF